MTEWESFKATVEEQQRAEADGGYAAGDGPYYNSDILAALARIAKAAKKVSRLLAMEQTPGQYDVDSALAELDDALTALDSLGEKE